MRPGGLLYVVGDAGVELLEAALQMAPDLKLDYSWINRRLKLRDHVERLALPQDDVMAVEFEDNSWQQYWDDISGKELDGEMVRAARAEERGGEERLRRLSMATGVRRGGGALVGGSGRSGRNRDGRGKLDSGDAGSPPLSLSRPVRRRRRRRRRRGAVAARRLRGDGGRACGAAAR